MTYAKDSLGRSTGRRFNMAAMKRELVAKLAQEESASYRGFEIERLGNLWAVDSWPSLYTSKKNAMIAVDKCLDLRAMLAGA